MSKQYYVKISFEFGTDEDGEYTPKNDGKVSWASMPYEAAVALQNQAIIPAMTQAIEKAGALGMAAAGNSLNAGKSER